MRDAWKFTEEEINVFLKGRTTVKNFRAFLLQKTGVESIGDITKLSLNLSNFSAFLTDLSHLAGIKFKEVPIRYFPKDIDVATSMSRKEVISFFERWNDLEIKL